ncbi:MAG: carotenoid oxygenase family protein [Gammaproteobacteria bacterium]
MTVARAQHKLSRRDFLTAAAALGLAPVLSARAGAEPAWTIGWRSIAGNEISAAARPIFGRLPGELRGTLYRNGPAKHGRAGRRYQHWFDGDGMVQSFRFQDGAIQHHGRMVETSKFRAEEEAGRMLYPAFGTPVQTPAGIREPDDMNVANISVLHFAGELMTLWEGGSAHILDPRSLATMGRKTWGENLKGAPFSAHPKRTPDGWLWNFGYDIIGARLAVYGIAPDGAVKHFHLLGDFGPLGMVHDFGVTERHLVFVLAPFLADPDAIGDGKSFLDWHRWQPQEGTRVLVVQKDDLARRRLYELPPFFFFHIANAYESGGGEITLDLFSSPTPAIVAEQLRNVMRGVWREEGGAASGSILSRLRLAPNGIGEYLPGQTSADFPTMPAHLVSKPYRDFYALASTGGTRSAPLFGEVARLGAADGRILDSHDYGDERIAEEHLFIPNPAGGGWLVGTVLDFAKERTLVSVLDAQALHAGPVAIFALPYALPLGLHGTFVPA